jgi:prepilin-type N-terminal cleavage/methylation domain-containing protein
MGKSNMQRCKGFTLIELLMAIVILMILATIAGLNLHAYTLNRNLRSAARDIASDFFICKERAVSENNTYQIVFDVAGSSYTIQQGTPAAVTKRPSSFGSDISIISADFGGGQTINFFTRGTVSPLSPPPGVAGDNSVILGNSRNSRATITVTMTGRTYVTFNIQ